MENGFDVKLADKLSELELCDPPNSSGDSDSFYLVTKAVEAAEATIKQQVEENNRLQIELHAKMKLLEKYKSHEMAGLSRHVDEWSENVHGTYEIHPVTASVGNPENGIKSMSRSSLVDQRRTIVIHKDINLRRGDTARQTSTEGLPESSDINGTLKGIASGQIPADNSGLAQLSSPSTSSFFPSRYQSKAEYDQQLNESGHGLTPMDEANNSNNVQKQDLINKIREHEQVILQLRRYLAEYSFKEANICNEKLVLEKRIGYMRLAFDQQQQDIVDASSKALSYRQDIMEENIRLSYQLQAAQHERFTFASSLLPLLAEYSLQPPVPDVQSIVSNVKVLFKHLSEQLNITESKIKESRFQLAPWHSEVNPLTSAFQSPAHLIGAGLATPNKSGLELVPSTLIPGRIQSPFDDQMGVGLDGLAQHRADCLPKTSGPDDSGRYFSHASSEAPIEGICKFKSQYKIDIYCKETSDGNTISQTVPEKADSHGGPYGRRHSEETTKQVKFREPVSTSEMDDPDPDVVASSNWPSSSPFDRPLDDPHSSYPQYLPGLEERSSSSISEGPDDDPLPGIDGLQISGDAFPGRELQACGYSINGTTSCNFEWVRHLEDGSVNYIEGAKQPNYLVTADDVGNYLAIEVQPLDNRKRKGELVKVFANEHSKITCDPEMQSYIEKTLYSGHASYKVSLSTGYLDIWEPATLVVKREGYTIKFHTSNGGVITEKFSRSTSVAIPYGHATVFSLLGSNNVEHILRVENAPEDVSCSRDTIVLTLRLFIMRAGQKPKGKKKGLFFNK